MAKLIYQRVVEIAGSGQNCHALDLYSGSGVIASQLAGAEYRVTTAEENPVATRMAEEHFADNRNVTVLTGKVEDLLKSLPKSNEKIDFIVINPSRSGIEVAVANFLREILEDQPHCCLVYISCELGSFARDAQNLCKNDVQINQIEAYDMFPHTEHLEWFGIFQAKQYKSLWEIKESK